jgi:ethanolamine ammonia-lyase small subunit
MTKDLWQRMRQATPARIGLGRAGAGLPTAQMLEFQFAHARARDAVHRPLDVARLGQELAPLQTLRAASNAPDRDTYLRRPDLGRQLAQDLPSPAEPHDVAFVIADGLSADAVQTHAAPVLRACAARLSGLSIAPVTIVQQGRVAIGDQIGQQMNARAVVVLIGERPGLTVADSLGAYLTFAPKPGLPDSLRNCVSNIHAQGGLGHDLAADRITWLLREALRLGLSGTGLKENSDATLLG